MHFNLMSGQDGLIIEKNSAEGHLGKWSKYLHCELPLLQICDAVMLLLQFFCQRKVFPSLHNKAN